MFLLTSLRRFWARLRVRFSRREFVCPFCFERLRLREAAFRCENSDCSAQTPDLTLRRVWGVEATGRVFSVDGVKFSAPCPACNHTSYVRLCPHCHKALPESFGLNEDFVIAVIGARNVGKSHFLAVLIDHIRKNLGVRFDMTIEFMDEDTNHRYLEKFYNPVFRDGKTIPATVSARTDPTVRTPLLYRLSRKRDNKLEVLATLAFFDTAGEDLNSQETMLRLNKYILNAGGVILLLDPLQMDVVRCRLPQENLPEKEADPLDIMQRVTNLYLRNMGPGGDRKIATPVAVCFSKFDAIMSLMDPSSQLLHKVYHHDVFNKADCDAIQSEIEAMLLDWGYGGLVNLIKVRYSRSAFFCFSALGSPPLGNRINGVDPFRIEDPFLWLLHKTDKID